jgi:cysteinyl-tRNA synthetase
MAEERARARGRRDFKAADEARRLLAEHGFEVRDTKDGAVELRPLAAKPRPA